MKNLKSDSKYVGEIDFLKFIFSIVILLFHTPNLRTAKGNAILFGSGYLGVDFFFIISGYLMAAHVLHSNSSDLGIGVSTAKYILKQLKQIFPDLLFAFIIKFCVSHILYVNDIMIPIKALVGGVFELGQLMMTGMKVTYTNSMTWYISAMFIVKFVLYPLLEKYRRTFTCVIAPLLTIVIMGIMSYNLGTIGSTKTWLGYGYIGTFRAAMGLSAGCLCYEIASAIRNTKFTALGTKVITVANVIAFAAILIYMQVRTYPKQEAFLVVIIFIFCIAIVFSKKTSISGLFSNQKIFKHLGKLSLAIYLNQSTMINLLRYKIEHNLSFVQEVTIYAISSILLAVISLLIVPVTTKALCKIKNKLVIEQEITS